MAGSLPRRPSGGGGQNSHSLRRCFVFSVGRRQAQPFGGVAQWTSVDNVAGRVRLHMEATGHVEE